MLVSGKLDISYLVYIARMFKTLDLDYKFSDDTSGQNLNCDCGVLNGAGTHNRSIFLPSNHQQVASKELQQSFHTYTAFLTKNCDESHVSETVWNKSPKQNEPTNPGCVYLFQRKKKGSQTFLPTPR